MENIETRDGQLIWNSGDARELSLVVNETEYNSASSTLGIFNGFNNNKQEPSQIYPIEISENIKAIVWAVDIWKEVDAGNWNSNFDLFYRILDTSTGEFLTNEVRITDNFDSDYINGVFPDDNGGFQITWQSGSNEYPYEINIENKNNAYEQSDIIITTPEFETRDGQLIWNSGDARELSLVVNETEYNSASSTLGIFNGFNNNKQEPSQIYPIEISENIKAIVWAVDIWKEVDAGNWNSNFDLFYRILDTSTGEFLTNEVRITDNFDSDYINGVFPDDNGGFQITWQSGSNEYPYEINIENKNNAYEQSDIIITTPEFETRDGQLIWNSGDARELSLVVNETEYNSASSTLGIFNGFNNNKQEPSQIYPIEISENIKAIVWAVDIWKEVDAGNWNSNFDLFYRILDTSTGEFLTNEVRITDNFDSDYINGVFPDDNGGFQITWQSGSNEYPSFLSVATNTENNFEQISGEVLIYSDNDNEIFGTNDSDIIFAKSGNDIIYPGYGIDHIYGGDGFDKLIIEETYTDFDFRTNEESIFDIQIVNFKNQNKYFLYDVEEIIFNGGEEIVKYSVDPFWNYEKIYLGSGDDIFIGDVDGDYIETGGGSDKIMSGAGDDVVVVQASEEDEALAEPTIVEIDTGLGDDHIVVRGGRKWYYFG